MTGTRGTTRRTTTLFAMVLCLAAIAGLGLPRTWADEGSASRGDCGRRWSRVPTPAAGASSTLYGIAARTSRDAWAVGTSRDAGSQDQTLVERWDGSMWTVVPSPQGNAGGILFAVESVASNDAWAVGTYDGGPLLDEPLIERWDGRTWSVVPSPNPMPETNTRLYAVEALSADDVWAVGVSHRMATILHWNGEEWTLLPAPDAGRHNSLHALVPISSTEVWAVGHYHVDGSHYRTLVERWDGTSWTVVPSPNSEDTDTGLLFWAAAVAPNDIWAAGWSHDVAGVARTLIQHWDGTAWTNVSSPNAGDGDNLLWGLAADARGRVRAVGSYEDSGVVRTLILEWNGSAWRIAPSPTGTGFSSLFSTATMPGGGFWAAGSVSPAEGSESGLVVRQCLR
jgi:hypothetical protein